MPDGDNNKTPLFSVKNTEGETVSSTESVTPTTGLPTEQEEQPKVAKSLFDIKAPDPVKKKEPTMVQETPKPVSTSQSESSTSGLAGSSLATFPGGDKTQVPVLTSDQVAIGQIDFESLYDPNRQDAPPLPKMPTLKEVRIRDAQRLAIENQMRKAVLKDPTILDLPGFEEAVNKKILDLTGGDHQFADFEKSIQGLKREVAISDSDSGAELDVTPDFNTNQIFNNIQKASADLKKKEMLAQGKSEEEADASTKILFPERDINKTVETGLNIEKVKKDYLSFLAKNNPEKLKDIRSAQAVENFEGERSLRFMEEALSHQAEMIDIKIKNILTKGKDQLTEQDIQEIQKLEGQMGRLGKRYESLIFDYPEIREKMIKEKIAQREVDESYKAAKAKAIEPGWDGQKAAAEVLYHQVISPIGSASVDMIGNVLKLGINQFQGLPGLSDNEIIQGTAGIMSDWANGFFDTEKSSSIYKKPSELKGDLFENGDLQAEKLVPKTTETLWHMYTLLAGGATSASALEKVGFCK